MLVFVRKLIQAIQIGNACFDVAIRDGFLQMFTPMSSRPFGPAFTGQT